MMLKKILLLAVVGSLSSCAGTAPQSGQVAAGAVSSESKVSARAEARWQAMVNKDLDGVYEFLSPGSKAANSLEIFKSKIRPLDWQSAKAISASCDAEKCNVSVKVTFLNRHSGGAVATVLEETWIKDAGNWWYVFNT